jgi:hypothetical protein
VEITFGEHHGIREFVSFQRGGGPIWPGSNADEKSNNSTTAATKEWMSRAVCPLATPLRGSLDLEGGGEDAAEVLSYGVLRVMDNLSDDEQPFAPVVVHLHRRD